MGVEIIGRKVFYFVNSIPLGMSNYKISTYRFPAKAKVRGTFQPLARKYCGNTADLKNFILGKNESFLKL